MTSKPITDIQSSFGTYALTPLHGRFLSWAQSMPVSWLGRRGALFLRKAVLLAGQGVVDAVVDGLKLRLYMRDNVSERKFLFMPQFFDKSERDLLKRSLKPGDVFVDIGANAGIYTMTAAALVGSEGKVLSIEPNPMVLDRLRFNAGLNGFGSRVITEQAAVSDASGAFDLVLDDSNLGGSSLVAARSDRKITVQCHRLMDVLSRHGMTRIAALKIDIEGAEDKALIPFLRDAPPEMLPRHIILENSVWQQDLKGALTKAGYRLAETTRMNMIWSLV
jgi:FkbM family methyltransferase